MTNPHYEPLAVDIRCGNCRGHVLYKPVTIDGHFLPLWECTSCHMKCTLKEINTYRYLMLGGEPSLPEKAADNATMQVVTVNVGE